MLESHKKLGKRIVPPLADVAPWKEVSWIDELLPELLWIGLLKTRHGLATSARVCAEVTKAAEAELQSMDQTRHACLTGSFESFGTDQFARVRERLEAAHVFHDLNVAISPLCVAYPECPLAPLAKMKPDIESATAEIRRQLPAFFDRREEEATFIQILAVYMMLIQGRLSVSEETPFANFPAVEEYPHTEESRRIASGCRAITSMLADHSPNESGVSWPTYFWNRGLELEKCRPIGPIEESLVREHGEEWSVDEVLSSYRKMLYDELEARIGSWPVDLAQREVHEVVGGLLARQATLGIQLSSSPGIWNGHVAPMILRTMVDTLITVAWIVQSPVERARKFILYGLGQEKLAIEHRSELLKDSGRDPSEDPLVQHQMDWLESQRFAFMTEVNLGSWSGISARQMAEQAGCLEIYRHAYTPFSAATHSTWQHVARYNLVHCESPLHRYHRIPWISPVASDLDYLYRGAKYVEETFGRFETAFNLQAPQRTAFAFLRSALVKVVNEQDSD